MKKKKYYELIIMETHYDRKPVSIYELGNCIIHRHLFETEKDRDLANKLIGFYNVPHENEYGHYVKVKVINGNEMKLNEKETKNYE